VNRRASQLELEAIHADRRGLVAKIDVAENFVTEILIVREEKDARNHVVDLHLQGGTGEISRLLESQHENDQPVNR
jgi:hypothetical protein